MGVQDIVQLYEGKASGSDPKGSLLRRTKYKPRKSDAEIIPSNAGPEDSHEETAVQEPVLEPPEPAPSAIPNRPARFVRHPFFHPHYQRIKTPDIPLRALSKSPERLEVVKEGPPKHSSPTPGPAEGRTPAQSDEGEPLDSNYSDVSTLRSNVRATNLVKQSVDSLSPSITVIGSAVDDSATLTGSHSKPLLTTSKDPSAAVHRPVPAPTLFGRNAAPLYLPKLDKYLSSLPAPEFTRWTGSGKEKDVPMFPPMDQLAASKRTIDDLEHNSTVTPVWRDRNFWFSLANDAVIGIVVRLPLVFLQSHPNDHAQGSSALAPFYSVQGLIDTLQIFALLLSTIGSSIKRNAERPGNHFVYSANQGSECRELVATSLSRDNVGVIKPGDFPTHHEFRPNVLALNFAKTPMGALVYLLVLMFITLALLFYMLYVTKEASRLQIQEGFQPPTVPGGLGIMIVTFLLMVLYLPLSTMALHVVIWSGDLWVVPNPYINATSLPPILDPLGPPDQYRNPLDFCWTTTMKRNEINFAPAVVVCALIVMATVSFIHYGSPVFLAYLL